VVSKTDGNGNTTSYTYSDSYTTSSTPPCHPGCYAFASQTTNALNQTTSAAYDYFIGKPTNITDTANGGANGPTTTYTYGDVAHGDYLDRLTVVNYPDGGSVSFSYNDPSNKITTTTALTSPSDSDCAAGTSKISDLIYDGLGRTSQTIDRNPEGYVYVETEYDGLGRSYNVTNPYLAGQTLYWTTTTYDGLSRVVQVQTADNSVVDTGYSGNTVTVLDQAGKWRQSQTDAAGRLTQVIEDPTASITLPSGSQISNAPVAPATSLLNYTTTYTYDALDDLINVNQSGLARKFTYDSLKRLVTAQTPESGTINYTYDSNGNAVTRQDARFNTTMAYDKLNRLIQRSYTDPNTSTVSLCYDGLTTATSYNGAVNVTCSGATALTNVNAVRRLTWEGNGSSSSAYKSFDQMGRVSTHAQTTAGTPYSFSYAYNVDGQLERETYPGGRKVQSCYDTAGRPDQLQNVSGASPFNYVSQVTYSPPISNGGSAIKAITLGDVVGGQQSIQETYSSSPDRLQLYRVTVASLSQTFLTLTYGYCPSGSSCTTNNGNVLSQQLQRPGGSWTDTYCYDAVNRLTAGLETGTGSWMEGYQYDAFGNRWVSNPTQGCTIAGRSGLPALTAQTPNAAGLYNGNNQVVSSFGWSYDGSGNVTQSGTGWGPFTYDAENRQLTATISGAQTSYAYDGAGRRVQKTGPAQTTYVYDALGQLAAEYGSADDTGTKYVTWDALGSTRLETMAGASGPFVWQNYDYMPFGEELGVGTGGRDTSFSAGTYPSTPSGPSMRFTGKERDAETGLDYFGARYMSSAQGRFTSPDTVMINPQLDDPQLWNKYAYVGNRPMAYVDPDGRWPFWIHDRIINEAFTGFLNAGDRRILQTASAYVDRPENQDAAHACQHGMSNGLNGESPDDAHAETLGFISDQLDQAVQAQIAAEGDHPGVVFNSVDGTQYADKYAYDSLFHLGEAIHAGTDSYSPPHAGSQPWTGHETAGQVARHVWAESKPFGTEEAQYEARLEALRIYQMYLKRLEEARKRKQQEDEQKQKKKEEHQ
jgi:RHS repeat-associated protein